MSTILRLSSRLSLSVAAVSLLALVAGCADTGKRKSLENVAKGWCETIRASQVIPVYPLTEDLRPGDVFLVQTSVAAEAERYRKRGFLALDDFRTRLGLKPASYGTMYFDGYWEDEFASEHGNPRPTRTGGAFPKAPGGGESGDGVNPASLLSQAKAPRAAFPTYTFDISTSKGLGLALPIKGIPVAMGFLRADRATGSVTIADARTYSADPGLVYAKLRAWAETPEVRLQLMSAARQSRDAVYVRVVTRVYLTGAVNVSVTRKVASAGDLKAGKAPNVELIDETGKVDPNYKATLGAINQTAPTGESGGAQEQPTEPGTLGAAAAPKTSTFDWANAGGTFKFTSLSSSSVSLAETFDTLLAIGYLGFDVPVFKDGSLGQPIPTFQRLESLIPTGASYAGALTSGESGYKVIEKVLETELAADPKRAIKILEKLLPEMPWGEFEGARSALKAAKKEGGNAAAAVDAFKEDAANYVADAGGGGMRGEFLLSTFSRVYAPMK